MIKEVIDLPQPGSRYWHVGSVAKIFLGTYSLPPPAFGKAGGEQRISCSHGQDQISFCLCRLFPGPAL